MDMAMNSEVPELGRGALTQMAYDLHVFWVVLNMVSMIDANDLPGGTRILIANFRIHPTFFSRMAEKMTMVAVDS
eukprot:723268-Rhodomonas_salina.1